MFLQEDVIKFVNFMINCNDNNDNLKNNFLVFKDYLELTKLADGDTLTKMEMIFECMDALVVLKGKLGVVDVESLFSDSKVDDNLTKGVQYQKTRNVGSGNSSVVVEKHYHHYTRDKSSNCGSSSPSYSSNCGSGYIGRTC